MQATGHFPALTQPTVATPGTLTPQQVACEKPVNINSSLEGPISILGQAQFSRPRIAPEELGFFC